jgi:hypothetical protein
MSVSEIAEELAVIILQFKGALGVDIIVVEREINV